MPHRQPITYYYSPGLQAATLPLVPPLAFTADADCELMALRRATLPLYAGSFILRHCLPPMSCGG
ncbi:MAG: hypothetical protein ACRYFK_06830 [Janthinobacterium lividum]